MNDEVEKLWREAVTVYLVALFKKIAGRLRKTSS
jgi:hypothetical protein